MKNYWVRFDLSHFTSLSVLALMSLLFFLAPSARPQPPVLAWWRSRLINKTTQHCSIKTESMKSAYARFGVKKCASMHVARTHASGTWEAFPWSTPLGHKEASLGIWVVFGMVQWFSGDSRNKSQAVAAKKLCPGLIGIYNMYLESKWHVQEVDSKRMDLRHSWQFKTPHNHRWS